VNRIKAAVIATGLSRLKAALNAFTLPLESYPSVSAARTAVNQRLAAYYDERRAYDEVVRQANDAEFNHPKGADYDAAAMAAVQPWLTKIDARRTQLNCPAN